MNYKHFRISEFYCKCDRDHDEHIIDENLVLKLDFARMMAKIPFIVTSGYRCPQHNAEVGGVPKSSHMIGKAADIRAITSKERYKILSCLLLTGFRRVGIGKAFIHVDIDDDKTLDVCWTYDK